MSVDYQPLYRSHFKELAASRQEVRTQLEAVTQSFETKLKALENTNVKLKSSSQALTRENTLLKHEISTYQERLAAKERIIAKLILQHQTLLEGGHDKTRSVNRSRSEVQEDNQAWKRSLPDEELQNFHSNEPVDLKEPRKLHKDESLHNLQSPIISRIDSARSKGHPSIEPSVSRPPAPPFQTHVPLPPVPPAKKKVVPQPVSSQINPTNIEQSTEKDNSVPIIDESKPIPNPWENIVSSQVPLQDMVPSMKKTTVAQFQLHESTQAQPPWPETEMDESKVQQSKEPASMISDNFFGDSEMQSPIVSQRGPPPPPPPRSKVNKAKRQVAKTIDYSTFE